MGLSLNLHGVLLLDKPLGLSSNQALGKVKSLLQTKKAGHTGTLDPLATGLLPICLGEATKFSADLLAADKTYETVVQLGVRTSTGDAEGEVLSRCIQLPDRQRVEAILPAFRGTIMQVPPMYSALKHAGKALYDYARAGVEIERPARQVRITSLDCLSYDATTGQLQLQVRCSKGTYIRTLGEDIGTAFGCGAHLASLRRLAVGELTLSEAINLPDLQAAVAQCHARSLPLSSLLLPVDHLLRCLPVIELPAGLAQRFAHGQRLALRTQADLAAQCDRALNGLTDSICMVRVYGPARALLGTAELAATGRLQPQRLVNLGESSMTRTA